MAGFGAQQTKAATAAEKNLAAVRALRKKARIIEHVPVSPENLERRAELETDKKAWLKYFFPEIFFWEWGADHIEAINQFEHILSKSGYFAYALPRGSGKTMLARCLGGIYAPLTGSKRYVIFLGATEEDGRNGIEFVKYHLEQNDLLYDHYSDLLCYVRGLEGKAIRARYQLQQHEELPTNIRWSADMIVLPTIIDPATGEPVRGGGGILECKGITGAIRGRVKAGGKRVIRPDLIIPDDPQTRESAESPAQCDALERRITGDLLGLAGPNKRISAFMPCTIIRKGDLADRFLDKDKHPEWRPKIGKLVSKFPVQQDKLWKEYATIYYASDDPERKDATEFYESHRAAMDEGAEMAWKARVREGEVSALQTAENMLLEMRDQFWAEMQNEPLELTQAMYSLTPTIVTEHQIELPSHTLPPQHETFVGHCDINRSGLHFCLGGFDRHMTLHIPLYGKHPGGKAYLWEKNANELVRKQAIFQGLKQLCAALDAMDFKRDGARVRIQTLLIDRGYEPDVVSKFCASSKFSFRVIPARGYASHKYWVRKASLLGRPFGGCHLTRTQFGPMLSFNADYWREASQRALIGEVGSPGGATLFKARKGMHDAFAVQVCSEPLTNKYQTPNGWRWEYLKTGDNDWGDALTGCYAAAAMHGLDMDGISLAKTEMKPRSPKVWGANRTRWGAK